MKRVTWKAGLVLAAFALLYCSGPVVAKDQVPFKGTLQTTAIVELFPGGFNAEIEGGGQATHLGRYTWESAHTVLFTTPFFTVTGGDLTLTAANGDQLFGTYSGTSQFIGLNLLSFTLNITIDDGTGRFEGATGTIIATGVVNTTGDNPSIATLVGTISSVGSNKK
jgi:hypothetical protein